MDDIALVILLVALVLALVALAAVVRRSRRRERRIASVLEQLPETAVSVFDTNLRLAEVHGEVLRPADLSPDDFLGKRIDEVFEGAPGQQILAAQTAALKGEASAFEFASPFTSRRFWLRVAPLVEHGDIVGGMAVAQNVTDLRRAERSVSAEARRRYLILDAMNEAYVATDGKGVVTGWNRAAERIFGWSAQEAIGRSVADLIIPEEERAELFMLLERRLADSPAEGHHHVRAERGALDRSGRRFTVELNATLAEVDGETVLLSLMHDISDRKRDEHELRRHAEDVEALADAIGELARSTVGNEARAAICRAAARIAGADMGVLYEPEASGTGIRVTASEGCELTGQVLQFSQRAGSLEAFSSRELLFVSDALEHPAYTHSVFSGTDAKSILWVPVHDGDDALGVIAIAWRERVEALPERLEKVMSVIGAEAAVAIERAGMLDRLEQMARTDVLTGLINRRAWDDELSREVVRATREGTPLAVAMLDLDRFKLYNDRHGHQAGDRLLREAASAWRSVLRETDLLARYGGEEFAVALPGCDAETAAQLVERLRAVTPEGESCYAGLACWDEREAPDELVGRADRALYAAKQSGRDRTIVG
jgi:diguanylate cyclase (GGDEF)-like protein/PAS domain S-box-containing protein